MNDFYSHNIITIWVVAFVLEIAMGMLAQTIAEKKGHSKHWFWAGFLLSFIGVIWAAGLPDETLRQQFRRLSDRSESPGIAESTPRSASSIEENDGELAAVLSAAVAAMGDREGSRFILRSFRPAGEGSTAWSRAVRGRPTAVSR